MERVLGKVLAGLGPGFGLSLRRRHTQEDAFILKGSLIKEQFAVQTSESEFETLRESQWTR